MKIELEIDPYKYGLIPNGSAEVIREELHALYQKIWCEACYDPTNSEWQKWSITLLPHIQKLNQVLKFKD